MFQPSMIHLQALKENGSKTTQVFYKNAHKMYNTFCEHWEPKMRFYKISI
jgi:hypothetical protein